MFPAGRRLPADGAAAVPGGDGAPGPARPLRRVLQHHQRGGPGTQLYALVVHKGTNEMVYLTVVLTPYNHR